MSVRPPGREGGGQAVAFFNCASARMVGSRPARAGQPGYRDRLDRDEDGVSCEWLARAEQGQPVPFYPRRWRRPGGGVAGRAAAGAAGSGPDARGCVGAPGQDAQPMRPRARPVLVGQEQGAPAGPGLSAGQT
ncbi:MAG: excalibur calcium-binding domain-containing protein [Acetobacteraceae bacterium]|nr:excalibur calcium-binding domain-containing protein [Acetobacteraceae bacterium]